MTSITPKQGLLPATSPDKERGGDLLPEIKPSLDSSFGQQLKALDNNNQPLREPPRKAPQRTKAKPVTRTDEPRHSSPQAASARKAAKGTTRADHRADLRTEQRRTDQRRADESRAEERRADQQDDRRRERWDDNSPALNAFVPTPVQLNAHAAAGSVSQEPPTPARMAGRAPFSLQHGPFPQAITQAQATAAQATAAQALATDTTVNGPSTPELMTPPGTMPLSPWNQMINGQGGVVPLGVPAHEGPAMSAFATDPEMLTPYRLATPVSMTYPMAKLNQAFAQVEHMAESLADAVSEIIATDPLSDGDELTQQVRQILAGPSDQQSFAQIVAARRFTAANAQDDAPQLTADASTELDGEAPSPLAMAGATRTLDQAVGSSSVQTPTLVQSPSLTTGAGPSSQADGSTQAEGSLQAEGSTPSAKLDNSSLTASSLQTANSSSGEGSLQAEGSRQAEGATPAKSSWQANPSSFGTEGDAQANRVAPSAQAATQASGNPINPAFNGAAKTANSANGAAHSSQAEGSLQADGSTQAKKASATIQDTSLTDADRPVRDSGARAEGSLPADGSRALAGGRAGVGPDGVEATSDTKASSGGPQSRGLSNALKQSILSHSIRLAGGGGTAQVTLQTGSQGPLGVSVTVGGGVVDIQLATQDDELSDTLTLESPALIEAIRKQLPGQDIALKVNPTDDAQSFADSGQNLEDQAMSERERSSADADNQQAANERQQATQPKRRTDQEARGRASYSRRGNPDGTVYQRV